MATRSSILAWEISQTEETGGLQSMGAQSQTRLSDWAHTHRIAGLVLIWLLFAWCVYIYIYFFIIYFQTFHVFESKVYVVCGTWHWTLFSFLVFCFESYQTIPDFWPECLIHIFNGFTDMVEFISAILLLAFFRPCPFCPPVLSLRLFFC